MIKTITKSEFTAAFHNMGRGKQFSHKGLCALYDYLTELEQDCEMNIELDVIGLCCEFTEYDDLNECLQDTIFESEAELQDNTLVIHLDNGGVIIQAI